MTLTDEVEVRAALKLCVGLDKTPIQAREMIESGLKRKIGMPLVYKWYKRFRDGDEAIETPKRTGRPAVVRPSNVDKVRAMIEDDRRVTVRAITGRLGTSLSVVHQIITKDLRMSKVSARWVPRLLTDHDKQRRVACSGEFLRRYATDGEKFLDRIVTLDETWLYHYDPESKAQSAVWKTANTPPPRKAKSVKSAGKHMFVYFFDRQGMILQHRVPDGQPMNADYYSEV